MTPWLALAAVTLLALAAQHRTHRCARAKLAKVEAVCRLALAEMQADLDAERQHAATARAEATEAARAEIAKALRECNRLGEAAKWSDAAFVCSEAKCDQARAERDALKAQAEDCAAQAAYTARRCAERVSERDDARVKVDWLAKYAAGLERELDASTAAAAHLNAELTAARVRLARYDRARSPLSGRFSKASALRETA